MSIAVWIVTALLAFVNLTAGGMKAVLPVARLRNRHLNRFSREPDPV